jgi:hypothetical protein
VGVGTATVVSGVVGFDTITGGVSASHGSHCVGTPHNITVPQVSAHVVGQGPPVSSESSSLPFEPIALPSSPLAEPALSSALASSSTSVAPRRWSTPDELPPQPATRPTPTATAHQLQDPMLVIIATP